MQGWGRAEASYYRRGYGMRVRARRNGRQRKWRAEKLLVVPPPKSQSPPVLTVEKMTLGEPCLGKLKTQDNQGQQRDSARHPS